MSSQKWLFCSDFRERHYFCTSRGFLATAWFLADRTNGRAIVTLLHLSVVCL